MRPPSDNASSEGSMGGGHLVSWWTCNGAECLTLACRVTEARGAGRERGGAPALAHIFLRVFESLNPSLSIHCEVGFI